MGSELITYICFGPKHFTKTQIKKARAEIERQIKLVKECLEMGEEESQQFMDKWGKTEPGLAQVAENGELELLPTEPYEVIDVITAVWEGNYTDTNERPVPNPTKGGIEKVIVAGGMSWGDEPDGGGFQGLKLIEVFNLYEILGVC